MGNGVVSIQRLDQLIQSITLAYELRMDEDAEAWQWRRDRLIQDVRSMYNDRQNAGPLLAFLLDNVLGADVLGYAARVEFMKEELAVRKQLKYPPFSRIVLASFSSPNKDTLHRVVTRWVGKARETCRQVAGRRIDVLGPVPPPIERVKNRYRLQVLIKGALTASIRQKLMDSYRAMAERQRGGSGVDLRWDVDPESFY